MKLLRHTALFTLVLSLTSCGLSQGLVFEIESAPDYNELEAWAGHPEIQDLTDSIPAGATLSKDGDVPVFFVYPTVYFPKKGESWNAPWQSPDYRARVAVSMEYQATAFNAAGPIYAPYYRQSAYQVYTTTPNVTTQRSYELAFADVKSAFATFMRQIGPETPYILASHSQGTDHLVRLLKEMSEEQRDRLVVAYLVGMAIDDCAMPLPVCSTPEQTHCYIGWRTYGYGADIPKKVPDSCLIPVNPLSWLTETGRVEASENPGALIRFSRGLDLGVASAEIADGVVYSKRPRFPGSWFLRTKNYHRGDINLYYESIRRNAILRVGHWKRSELR